MKSSQDVWLAQFKKYISASNGGSVFVITELYCISILQSHLNELEIVDEKIEFYPSTFFVQIKKVWYRKKKWITIPKFYYWMENFNLRSHKELNFVNKFFTTQISSRKNEILDMQNQY